MISKNKMLVRNTFLLRAFIIIAIFFISTLAIGIMNEIKLNKLAWEAVKAYHKLYKFNNLYLRGSKDIMPKAQNVYRIVCLGDSWTFGLNVPEDKSYPSLLSEYFRKKDFRERLEVINAGYPGNTLEEMYKLLLENIEILTPDCLVILGGMNSLLKSDKNEKRDIPRILLSSIEILASRNYFSNLLIKIPLFFEHIFFPSRSRKKISEYEQVVGKFYLFLDNLKKKEVKIIFLNYPLPKAIPEELHSTNQNRFRPYQNYLIDYCLKRDSNSYFIDLFRLFNERKDSSLLFLDLYHTHPNEKGYELIAQTVGDYILNNCDLTKYANYNN